MNLLGPFGLRRRLALLYLSLFAVALSVFCAVLFQFFQKTQIRAFDTTLYNFAIDVSSNLEMDFVGRLFVLNSNPNDSGKVFPFHLGGSFLEIRDLRGKSLYHTRSLKGRSLPLSKEMLHRIPHERFVFETIRAQSLGLQSTSADLRLLTFWAQHPGWLEPLIILVAVPMDLPTQERQALLLFFLLAIPSFLVVCGIAGIWLSKRALKPVHDMTMQAQQITGVEKLKNRIPVPLAQDEIHELATTFNSLLDRLDLAFASQDRFVSNASHQLKTPLTILKGELERLNKTVNGTSEQVREGLESARSEIDRLIQLVNDLLVLARLEAGHDSIALTPVHLDDILMRVVSRIQKLARLKNVQIQTLFSSERPDAELEISIAGDEELLDSMIENFLENAVKYAPENSLIQLNMKVMPNKVYLSILDEGPGIPSELKAKMFERFSRVQPSNSVPGSGLGLSIASEIARLHKVEIDLNDGPQNKGTLVTLTFPQAEALNDL